MDGPNSSQRLSGNSITSLRGETYYVSPSALNVSFGYIYSTTMRIKNLASDIFTLTNKYDEMAKSEGFLTRPRPGLVIIIGLHDLCCDIMPNS